MQWLVQRPENHRYFVQLQTIWEKSRSLAASSTVNPDKAWERFQQRIQPREPVKRLAFSWWRVAALVLVMAISAIWVVRLNQPEAGRILLSQTGEETKTDTLSDGSLVTLNKQSSLQYPEKFSGNTRKVDLEGEAFFQVSPDKEKPFIIDVKDVQVEVVGTSFNIKTDAEKTEVVVETGIVNVSSGGQTITLRAGQKTVVKAAQPLLVEEEKDKLYNYYRSREFVCDDTPLWKLVDVLNKAYDTTIIIGRPELRNLQLNTTFSNESLERILDIIHETFDITITQEAGRIVLE